MLEPIMEETSEDEEHALNSWNQYEQSTQRKEEGASFWSSAESETGSVIRIEINKGIIKYFEEFHISYCITK